MSIYRVRHVCVSVKKCKTILNCVKKITCKCKTITLTLFSYTYIVLHAFVNQNKTMTNKKMGPHKMSKHANFDFIHRNETLNIHFYCKILIIELAHLQNGYGKIRVQSTLKKYQVHGE